MGRIMGVDYGQKRTGIAVTDPLKIIVNGLITLETKGLMDYLSNYINNEVVEKIVFGLPTHKDGNFTYLKPEIDLVVENIKLEFNDIDIDFIDESFTSFESKKIILQSGANKKKRQDKALVDKISAVLILQKYLGHI